MNVTEIEKGAPNLEPLPFTIRYAEVPISGIKGRIIRNPNYGGPTVSIYGWHWHSVISQHRKPKFQEALRDSIAAEGVRNPIVVYATDEGDFVSFGGSRVYAARDVGLRTIPALVNDYCGRYDEGVEVTEYNVRDFFTDVPRYLEFTATGVDTHYHMERNRRGHIDEAGYAWMPEGAEWIDEEFPWLKDGNNPTS